jgi:hypothetical protein
MLSTALWFAGRTGRPRSRGRVAGTKVNTHTAPGSIHAECRVREPGGNGSGLGGRRQSRRSRIPAALLSVKNLAAPAVKREAEEDWGYKRWSHARRRA